MWQSLCSLLNQTSTLFGYLFGVSVFVVRIKVLSGGTCEVKCLRLFQSLYDNNIFSEEKNVF